MAARLKERIGVEVGYQSFMPDEAPMESVDFALDLGLGLIEFNANMPWFFPEQFNAAQRAEIRSKAHDAGLTLAIHAPEEISLVSPHSSLLSAGVDRMKDFIELASDLGAQVLTCHLGGNYLRWSTGDGRALFPHELYGRRMKESILKSLPFLARHANEKGVKLALENAGYFGPEIIQETVAETMAAAPLYLTWDLGHSNTRGGMLQRHEEFLLARLERVALFHLHDNDGSSDSHGVLGTGTLDLPRTIDIARRADAPISIEVRPRALIPACVAALLKALA